MPEGCQTEACALQTCIGKNTYQPENCEERVRALYMCCQKMYAEDSKARSTACPIESVVKRWIRDHPETSGSK
ncbi:DUF1903-domain-containing protein [Mycena filopes]|nr:DUF1903-domain-containing protein [Mycena filopes]